MSRQQKRAYERKLAKEDRSVHKRYAMQHKKPGGSAAVQSWRAFLNGSK